MPNSLSAIDYVKSQLAEHLLEYSQAVTKVREELDSYYALTILSNARRGVMISTVQTVNDFCDLLDDIKMGRGRPAMRALRSIFESLITILDITSQSEAIDRYEEHYAVVMYQAATMNAGLTGITGNDLRAERHHRHKQQRTYKMEHDDAISKRGSEFARSWIDVSLRSRAARHGLTDDYDLYRVLSSSIHLSAGGIRGIERHQEGTPVFRFGPDLLNCPLVLNEGLRYFRRFVETHSDHTGIAADRVFNALATLESLRTAYRRLILGIDRSLWPDHLPIGTILVRALLPDGRRKWLLHDNQCHRIIECSDPETVQEEILESIEDILTRAESTTNLRDEWITVAVLDTTADPLPKAKWRPDGHLVPLEWNPHGLMLPWDQ